MKTESEQCESGCKEPVTNYDSDGTPLCAACHKALVDESKEGELRSILVKMIDAVDQDQEDDYFKLLDDLLAIHEKLLTEVQEGAKMNPRPEFLPCPFCGSADIVITSWSSGSGLLHQHCYWCSKCGTEGPQSEFKHEAKNLWNTRAPSPDAEALRSALQQSLEIHEISLHYLNFRRRRGESVSGWIDDEEAIIKTIKTALANSEPATRKEGDEMKMPLATNKTSPLTTPGEASNPPAGNE